MSDTENTTNLVDVGSTENIENTAAAEGGSLADLQGEWFILHVFTGYEKKVCAAIEQKVVELKLSGKIHKVLIPEENISEVKNNKQKTRKRMMYPGYVFINMERDDDTWYEIRKINGVSKFIGAEVPEPVPEKDIKQMLMQIGEKVTRTVVDFEVGESVKVISGPFRGYEGQIQEILPERGKVKVLIAIFGRSTPMELDFNQVEKNSN
ncbi:transcription termination/antitermination factor NusG [Candidatus Termititenax persephonae]|uniref:Transcription termination/antitermination protein NusG n=1 Tax=Candidatus Termititenax persephonae TaxID=2218525 RepID=A0A388TF31_9BACT|nr:transcription termination/antitermination factor NusG [Candidatus Termititenax persephonae]